MIFEPAPHTACMNLSQRFLVPLMGATIALALLFSACGSDAGEEGAPPARDEAGARPEAAPEDPAEETAAPTETTQASNIMVGNGMNLDLFFDGALATEPTTEDCTLSGGTTTTCYRITVAGAPVTQEIGPFCPTTTDATDAEGGLWFDGNGLYDVDGEFILNLAELYGDDNWMLYNEDGSVNVTETAEAFDLAARPNVDPQYQNHCVEGQIAWLDNGEPIRSTVLIPTQPVVASAAQSRVRNGFGVTLNGVRIDGSAPVDAILGAYTIAAFDDCGGHINPVVGYHMHGAVGCGEVEVDGHENIFGYALDGFGIYSAASDETVADLDECGGHTTDELGYHYHANPAEENSVLGCLIGEIAS